MVLVNQSNITIFFFFACLSSISIIVSIDLIFDLSFFFILQQINHRLKRMYGIFYLFTVLTAPWHWFLRMDISSFRETYSNTCVTENSVNMLIKDEPHEHESSDKCGSLPVETDKFICFLLGRKVVRRALGYLPFSI